MTCACCDVDFSETERCYIMVEEVDYDNVVDTKRFCSFGCLKRWYDL